MSGIPDVPATTDGMRQFLLAVKGAVETLQSELGVISDEVTATSNDLVPPAAPTGLSGSSASGGVTLTWTNPGDEDLLLVEVWEATTNVQPDVNVLSNRVGTIYAVPNQVSTFDRSGVASGQHLFYWVTAVDTAGNRSVFNASSGVDVYVTAGSGTGTPPSAPTGFSALAGFQDIWLAWTNPSASNLDHILIFENTTNNSATANIVASVTAAPSTAGAYDRSGLPNNSQRFYWLKAVDKDGNVSGFSAVASATTATIDPTDLGTVIGFSAPIGLSVTSALSTNGDGMQVVNINASWTAISDSRLSFYEVAFSEAGGSFIVFPTNTPFYNVRGRGNVSYDVKVRAVDRNGNRTGYSGTTTITSATPTITPAIAVNAGSTQINPGLVLISGATSLASWRDGGDLTKISGGSIAANTVAANVIQIGSRGLDITTLTFEGNTSVAGSGTFTLNEIAWVAGTISYIDDSGTPQSRSISANHTSYTGSLVYIYWTKGATTLSATTTPATAYTSNTVVLCTYAGSTNVNATYGRTIADGALIKTGTITADRIAANALTAAQIAAGTITATEIAASTITAAKIAANTITAAQIAANTITASQITAGTITANEIVAAGISSLFTNSFGSPITMTATPADLVSKAYTSGNSDLVMVFFEVFFQNFEAATGRTADVTILRDTNGGGYVTLNILGTFARQSYGTYFTGFMWDTPAASSTITYKLQGDTPDGINMTATSGLLAFIRWRR